MLYSDYSLHTYSLKWYIKGASINLTISWGNGDEDF